MPKYWGGNYFAHGRFPEVGQKQKTEERERKKERLNDGNYNGQATHGARKHAWRTQAAWANKFSHTGDSPKWVKSKRQREKKKEKRGETE